MKRKFLIWALPILTLLMMNSCEDNYLTHMKFYIHNMTDSEVTIVNTSKYMPDSSVVVPGDYYKLEPTVDMYLKNAWELEWLGTIDTVRIYMNGTLYTISKNDADGCLQRNAYHTPHASDTLYVDDWQKNDEIFIYDLTIERLEAIKAKQDAQ